MEEPVSYSIKTLQAHTGLSRSRIYLKIAEGVFDARKDGKRTIITGKSVRDYIETLPRMPIKRVAASA